MSRHGQEEYRQIAQQIQDEDAQASVPDEEIPEEEGQDIEDIEAEIAMEVAMEIIDNTPDMTDETPFNEEQAAHLKEEVARRLEEVLNGEEDELSDDEEELSGDFLPEEIQQGELDV